MERFRKVTNGTRSLAALAILGLACGVTYAGHVATKPGVYEVRTEEMKRGDRSLEITLVKPVTPRNPLSMVLFATGDAGWMGASGSIFDHLAEKGYYVAAVNSRQVVALVKKSGKLADIPTAAASLDAAIVWSKKELGLDDAVPVIVNGFSRGANLVVFAAGVKSVQHHVGGAVAIALTRETDFLQAPDAASRPPAVQVDDKGRIQTYPAIELAGSIPFAVIQSKGDKYVPAEEARRLFGPDSATRRLYEVSAKNHGFSGGEEEMIRDLDDALAWIEGAGRTP
jgi:hypothetical protein